MSINSLQSPGLPSRLWRWRDEVAGTVRQTQEHQRLLAAAASLVPADGSFADFLTPAINDTDLDAHFDAILSLPRVAIRADLRRTFNASRPPLWARVLFADGRADGLVDVLRRYHVLALRAGWGDIHCQVETDRARYARQLLRGGVDELLSGLHSVIRWRRPVLEADYPVDRTIDLAGRGLTVVPAYFCWDAPVTFIDTTGDRQPMLVCPANESPATAPEPEDFLASTDRLAALVGHTRARLLAQLSVPTTTSMLAARLGVTPAAISQHTTILRHAGLLSTSRLGRSVQHALTPLGRALLAAEA